MSGQILRVGNDQSGSRMEVNDIEEKVFTALKRWNIVKTVDQMRIFKYFRVDKNDADVVDIFLQTNSTQAQLPQLTDRLSQLRVSFSHFQYKTGKVEDMSSMTTNFQPPLWFKYLDNPASFIVLHCHIRFDRTNLQAFRTEVDTSALVEGLLKRQLISVGKSISIEGEHLRSENIFIDSLEYTVCKICSAFVNVYFDQNVLKQWTMSSGTEAAKSHLLFGQLQKNLRKSYKIFKILRKLTGLNRTSVHMKSCYINFRSVYS
ncbi:hypothetical protein AHF37_05359 [Paragonimus kellicotti]|nr:hypothetical protein AHF37_05359 [Paragonimus kellicotti]